METPVSYIILAATFGTAAFTGFLLMVVGLFKPSVAMYRFSPAWHTKKSVLLVWGILWIGSSLALTGVISFYEEVPTTEIPGEAAPSVYYVKPDVANVRECPSLSCKVIDALSQNAELKVPQSILNKYPDWIEVTFPDGRIGYVSKSVLSENPVSVSEAPPSGLTSTGGVEIGPWRIKDILKVGEYAEYVFCEPESARSGSTCGGLAGATTDPRGGNPPYSFVKGSGFLPPGMALELNGTLKGTPTQTGTYNFQLCAKDLYAGEGCQNLSLVVTRPEEIPKTVSEPPAKPSGADAPLTVDIISGICQLIKKQPAEEFHKQEFKGTASGPVNTDLDFSSLGNWGHDGLFELSRDPEVLVSSAWTQNRGWERGPNDPPTTEWTFTDITFYPYFYGKKTYVGLEVEASVKYTNIPEVSDTLEVPCQ